MSVESGLFLSRLVTYKPDGPTSGPSNNQESPSLGGLFSFATEVLVVETHNGPRSPDFRSGCIPKTEPPPPVSPEQQALNEAKTRHV